ncbi:hypothetical protein [Porphyrobacter sp. AAP82]|uniref:hypothetical protein n=1 Tax=Porphyrobacter sp. AAP82 TaxID=1248917 RepID=UPI000379ED63|nr:hypothetical protein [Porphyrobacter sp. AAP82]
MMVTIADIGRALREIASARAMHRALMIVVPYACVLVGLDVAAHYGDATGAYLPVQFFMSEDRSFGEFLEYTMTGCAALFMALCWQRLRAPVYLANALLLVWLTLDNWAELHERFGLALAPVLPIPAWLPLHANHLGELIFFGVVGVLWLAGMISAHRRSQHREAVHGLLIGTAIALIAVFGVFVDLLTSLGEHSVGWLNVLAFVEDEGEFAAIILVFALTVGIFDVERRRAGALPGTAAGLRTAGA